MAKTPVTVVESTTDNSVKSTKTAKTTTDLSTSLLEADVEKALQSNDPVEISKVQLKLLMSIATNLNKIDWKLWEFYTRLGK